MKLSEMPGRPSAELTDWARSDAIKSTTELKSVLAKTPALESQRLGEELLARGLVTADQIAHCVAEQSHDAAPRRLGSLLVEQGAIEQTTLNRVLQEMLAVPSVDLSAISIDPLAMYSITAEVSERLKVVPIMFFNGSIVVACENTLDTAWLDEVKFASGHPVIPVYAPAEDIERLLESHYGMRVSPQDVKSVLTVLKELEDEVDEESYSREVGRLAREAPVVRIVDAIINDAITLRASDIHLRPEALRVRLLYRIDGSLHHMHDFEHSLLPAMISRVKIMGRMNIAERRVPQDGHSSFAHPQGNVDLRLSTIPTHFGESLVIRILNKRAAVHTLDELGLSERDTARLRAAFNRSHGMFLVTGPTGSGKTTTLYAALKEVTRESLNVVTVEDPVEYEISGVRQIELLPQANFGFARALRHILRHDPDVVMVGEMRDLETAEVAVQAALTGHLVISTLHTNDAPSTPVRLIDMGVEPYLIRTALIGVLAQRLVRVNCPHCMEVETPDAVLRDIFGVGQGELFLYGRGCEACRHTGFSGRTAIYELFLMDESVGPLVRAGVSAAELKKSAVDSGMTSILDCGLDLARKGRVSLKEVYRACA